MSAPTFHFELIAPTGTAFSSDVTYVEAPGAEGRFGILAGHQSCVIGLAAGRLLARWPGDPGMSWDTGPGVLTVVPGAVTVLVSEVTPAIGQP